MTPNNLVKRPALWVPEGRSTWVDDLDHCALRSAFDLWMPVNVGEAVQLEKDHRDRVARAP